MLKDNPDVTENRLRAVVQMDQAGMRVAVGRLLGVGTAAKAG
jgi:hypothetical protein